MKINNRLLIILNLFVYVIFLFIGKDLDPFTENYSTLSLNSKSYLLLLVCGILIGLLLAYETSIIKNKSIGLIMFVLMLMGVIIPHHVPYNFQGNMHLLFGYISCFGVTALTYYNIYHDSTLRSILISAITMMLVTYMKYMMVTTAGEFALMSAIMLCNMVACIKTSRT